MPLTIKKTVTMIPAPKSNSADQTVDDWIAERARLSKQEQAIRRMIKRGYVQVIATEPLHKK